MGERDATKESRMVETTPRVVFGAGLARSGLADEVDRLGGARIMVIATAREHARQATVLAPLADRIVATFTAVRPHVPVEVAASARLVADEADADLLLAIGGGSTVGTAKAIALTSGRSILALPTTYAGSEVTPVWGLTEDGRKSTGIDPRVLPKTVLYDPDLTLTLPMDESMASGVNALAHAVDAFWAPHTNSDIWVRGSEAIRTLVAGLDAVKRDGADRDARAAALHGAMLAGLVFAQAGSGLHHKICHVLGGRYDLPHAQTHAVILPHVLAFNAPTVPDAADRIGAALGGHGAADAVTTLVKFRGRLGVPTALSDLGFDHDQIGAAADAILPSVPASNPRPVSHVDLVGILTAAFHGVVSGVTP
jgi:alcohol dehydrogenase class IV